jgi:putative DNA primase/helicase
MTLTAAIASAGMTPPQHIAPGRFIRFPGAGKGRSNRAGWCRLITPTLAIFGDWSTGLTEVWRDDQHRDDEISRQLLKQARESEQRYAQQQRAYQAKASEEAAALIRQATIQTHPYLAAKGFPELPGLVHEGKLLVPVRDCRNYGHVISLQKIDADGAKLFLTGSRTKWGVHRVGSTRPRRVYLCEGYATGLSLEMAATRLPGPHAVVACFSAKNLELVSVEYPGAFICADNDASLAGQRAAEATGLKWTMPDEVGTDYNDMMQRHGIAAVVEALRKLFHG